MHAHVDLAVTPAPRGAVADRGNAARVSEPTVSIGLPVYNGERYLREAIVSILSQTYTDFELIICDNASTDSTEQVCREFAARDRRIRYERNAVNIGGFHNHNRVAELARGRYFMWAAHDDVRAPAYLERCIEVLESEPSVVLCFSRTQPIDEHGRLLPEAPFDWRFDAPDAAVRFADLTRLEHMVEPIYGLMRTAVLRRTRLEGQYADSDRVVVAELSLHGPLRQVPEVLFFRREHEQQSTKMYPSRSERVHWFDPSGRTRVVFPHPRQFVELLRVVGRAPLDPRTKLRCHLATLRWLRDYRRRVVDDLYNGVRALLRPALSWLRTRTS